MRCVTIVLNGDDLRGLLVLIATGATGATDLGVLFSLLLSEQSFEDNELPELLLDDDDELADRWLLYPIRPNGG